MTPGIYLQRRRERIGRSMEEIARWLEMDLVAGGLNEDYRLKFRLEEALRLIEHDMLVATPAILTALGLIESLNFCPQDYAALVDYAADQTSLPPPPLCRSCGEKLESEQDRLCGRCVHWASTRKRFAIELDQRFPALTNENGGTEA